MAYKTDKRGTATTVPRIQTELPATPCLPSKQQPRATHRQGTAAVQRTQGSSNGCNQARDALEHLSSPARSISMSPRRGERRTYLRTSQNKRPCTPPPSCVSPSCLSLCVSLSLIILTTINVVDNELF